MSKLFRSFQYAFQGLRIFIVSERNAKIHLVATFMAVVISFALGLSYLEWCVIVSAITLVWVAEALNTAIEKLCNKTTETWHPLIKQVKDISAGAVLVAALSAAVLASIVWGNALF